MNVSMADVAEAIARLTLDKDPRRLDADSATLLAGEWHRALAGYPAQHLARAVDSILADPEARFPNIAEIVNATGAAARLASLRAAASARARADATLPGMPTGRPGSSCECDGGVVWARRVIPEKRGVDGELLRPEYPVDEVSPCPGCRPDDHAYQAGGHLHHDDDALLVCEHPRCRRRAEAKPIARRRATAP